jgi:hypothetical protein
VSFKGKNLRNISVSKVAIWNDGTETIHRSDIAEAAPLRVVVSDAELLDSTVLKTTSPANQFGLKQVENSVLVDFDYLDRHQGAIVQLVHTGKSSSNITLGGALKGSRPVSRRMFGMTKTERYIRGAGIFGVYFPFFVIIGPLLSSISSGALLESLSILALIVLLIFIEVFIFRYLPKMMRPVPTQFDSAGQMV